MHDDVHDALRGSCKAISSDELQFQRRRFVRRNRELSKFKIRCEIGALGGLGGNLLSEKVFTKKFETSSFNEETSRKMNSRGKFD